MITTTNTRFGVRYTSSEGTYRKDMVTEHWTTYPVRDMTKEEADDVVAHQLARGSCFTYEIIDLDVEEQVTQIRGAAAKAVRDAVGYDGWSKEDRFGEKGSAVKKVALMAADHAEAVARA